MEMRENPVCGDKVSLLGFGCMRWPMVDGPDGQKVIDQDAVFVASETYGEVVKTRVFEDFCTEQELSLYVCRKADPESVPDESQ